MEAKQGTRPRFSPERSQETLSSECAKSPEYAKQKAAQANTGETAPPLAEDTAADERQVQLRAIASDLLYWKGGLKVLRQAQLPKWRGLFQWQIEAKIEALQAAYGTLRAECAKPDGWLRFPSPLPACLLAHRVGRAKN